MNRHPTVRPSSGRLLLSGLVALAFSSPAPAYYVFNLPEPDANAVLYGDGLSYSGPILDLLFPGGTGSVYVNPANGNTTNFAFGDTIAGKVDDELNVIANSAGQEIKNQPDGTEEAYEGEGGQSGSADFFSTTEDFRNPDDKTGLIDDDPDAWDANLSVFADAYLDDNGELEYAPVFVFNNNEENDEASQTLLAWMQVIVRDSTGINDPIVFTLENSCIAGGGQLCFRGGEIVAGAGDRGGYFLPGDPGKDPALFSAPRANNDYPETDWDNGAVPEDEPVPGDFVVSGGDVCFDAFGVLQTCDGSQTTKVSHNLGADRISYLVYFPELADVLALYGSGALGGYDMISTDVRLGCNSLYIDGRDCFEQEVIDNGKERAFWSRAVVGDDTIITGIPEPSLVALLGIGIAALGFGRRQRR